MNNKEEELEFETDEESSEFEEEEEEEEVKKITSVKSSPKKTDPPKMETDDLDEILEKYEKKKEEKEEKKEKVEHVIPKNSEKKEVKIKNVLELKNGVSEEKEKAKEKIKEKKIKIDDEKKEKKSIKKNDEEKIEKKKSEKGEEGIKKVVKLKKKEKTDKDDNKESKSNKKELGEKKKEEKKQKKIKENDFFEIKQEKNNLELEDNKRPKNKNKEEQKNINEDFEKNLLEIKKEKNEIENKNNEIKNEEELSLKKTIKALSPSDGKEGRIEMTRNYLKALTPEEKDKNRKDDGQKENDEKEEIKENEKNKLNFDEIEVIKKNEIDYNKEKKSDINNERRAFFEIGKREEEGENEKQKKNNLEIEEKINLNEIQEEKTIKNINENFIRAENILEKNEINSENEPEKQKFNNFIENEQKVEQINEEKIKEEKEEKKTVENILIDEGNKNVGEIENEESDLTFRRTSMDDFIKKILEEAREKNKVDGEKDEKEKKNKEEKIKKQSTKKFKNFINDEEYNENELIQEKKDKNFKFSREKNEEEEEDEEDLIEKYLKRGRKGKGHEEEKEKINKINGYKNDDFDPKYELEKMRNRNFDDIASIKSRVKSINENLEEEEIEREKYKRREKRRERRNGNENGNEDDEDSVELKDFENFLTKFKKERQAMFGNEKKVSEERDWERSAETDQMIKEKTKNLRSVIDQQNDIHENVKSVSKQLEELERELREVRQVALDRRNRLDAMDSAVAHERKLYEQEYNAALERNKEKRTLPKYNSEFKEQLLASIQNKTRSKYRGEDDFMGSKRIGSVSSLAGLMDEQDMFLGGSPYHSVARSRFSRDGENPFFKQRNSITDSSSFDFNLPSVSRPGSRASIATMDTSGSSVDDFIEKIRNKYSFNSSETSRSRGSRLDDSLFSKNSKGYQPLDYESIVNKYSTNKNLGTSLGGSLSYLEPGERKQRALSVSDMRSSIHFDKNIGGYTANPSSSTFYSSSKYNPGRASNFSSYSSSIPTSTKAIISKYGHMETLGLGGTGVGGGGGGEFKSRFLDKVREKRASGTSQSEGQSSASILTDRVRAKLNSSPFQELPPVPTSEIAPAADTAKPSEAEVADE